MLYFLFFSLSVSVNTPEPPLPTRKVCNVKSCRRLPDKQTNTLFGCFYWKSKFGRFCSFMCFVAVASLHTQTYIKKHSQTHFLYYTQKYNHLVHFTHLLFLYQGEDANLDEVML